MPIMVPKRGAIMVFATTGEIISEAMRAAKALLMATGAKRIILAVS